MKTLKIIGAVLRGLLLAVLALLLLGNLYIIGAKALLQEENPTLFGYSWMVVLSGSMEPEISLDDLIFCKEEDSYAVGDVVTYVRNGSMTTHRIVARGQEGFITKGDANNIEDAAPVPEDSILGRVVFAIPKVGLVLTYLKTPLGMLCLVVVGLILIELPYLISKFKDKRKEGCE